VAAVCLFAAPCAWPQIHVNSSPNVVGSGARALGMGGAFIAVADDATAASWNPGGLTQLERPELSFVYSWKWFTESFTRTPRVSPDDGFEADIDEINYLSFAFPIPWTIAGRNLVLSLNYQRKYDFDRSLDFRARVFGRNAEALYDIDYDQEGSLSAISPAFGFEITDQLSIGMVMNIWNSALVPDNQWEITTKRRGILRVFGGGAIGMPAFGQYNTYEKFEDVEGINYTFGVLFKPTDRLSLGAVYHTAYSIDAKYTRMTRLRNPYGIDSYESDVRIEWPDAIGMGIAYRFPNDKLTLSLDVTRRDWDNFVQIDRRGGLAGMRIDPLRRLEQNRVSPITGLAKWQSPHDPTYTVRLGGEYVFVEPKRARQNYLPSLRAGLFYDPEPAGGRKDTWWGVSRGSGKPDDYFGVTIGGGVLIHNRVNLDAAYEYRWGNRVRRDTLAGAGMVERSFHEDVGQHLFYLSTVIYF
jgi:long-subunit fatty acid transport protein